MGDPSKPGPEIHRLWSELGLGWMVDFDGPGFDGPDSDMERDPDPILCLFS